MKPLKRNLFIIGTSAIVLSQFYVGLGFRVLAQSIFDLNVKAFDFSRTKYK